MSFSDFQFIISFGVLLHFYLLFKANENHKHNHSVFLLKKRGNQLELIGNFQQNVKNTNILLSQRITRMYSIIEKLLKQNRCVKCS